jgi:zinc transport system permease protein
LDILFADGGHWLEEALARAAALAPPGSFFSYHWNLHALLALVFVAITCGAAGPLVIGGRMAFFSDALAHSAFAGISIGFVLFTMASGQSPEAFWGVVTPIMVGFGMLVGFGIAWVRERTGLSSDTVIGVFFACAVGLASALRKVINDRKVFSLEDFLFGDPLLVSGSDLVALGLLMVVTLAMLGWMYNPLMLGGLSSSLARSRRLPHRLASYAFVVLLAVIVNLCVRTVGILLINALLVVPAAAAANVSRGLRRLFWTSVGLTLLCCLAGLFASWEVGVRTDSRIRVGIPGAVVLCAAFAFAVTAAVGPAWAWLRGGRTSEAPTA